MKKLGFILAFCLSLSITLKAQQNTFAPQGAEWYFDKFDPWGQLPQYVKFSVEGDSIIQGHQCSVISTQFIDTGHGDIELVYEENNKVYWFNPTNNNFTILYDFDAEVGDSWYCEVDSCSHLVTVASVDSVTWNGRTYRTQWVDSYEGDIMVFAGRIIEGIGYEKGLFPFVWACHDQYVFDHGELDYLRCYVEEGEILYHEGDYDCDYEGSPVTEHFDFSAVCETGQTLYYLITDEEQKTVKVTYPNQYFPPVGFFWEGYEKPQGNMILPSTVTYQSETYTVTAIDDAAFYECEGLTGTLVIPGSMTDIGENAFQACTGLNEIELQEGVTTIWHSAFYSCSGITSVSFPNTLATIFHYAFVGCSSLNSLHFPASLTTFYASAFTLDSSLETITVDENNPQFYSENNSIIRRDDKTLFLGCKNTVIPDDIVTIGENAFNGAGDGGDLVIPNSVTTIGDYAFKSCHFSGTITLSESLATIGIFAFANSDFSGSLTIPNTVTSIGLRAFEYCQNLTGELKISESLSVIEHATFSQSAFTGTLVIPYSVTTIVNMAFDHCQFSDLDLGHGVSFLYGGAFSDCVNFTGILRIPASVTFIDNHVFRNTYFDEIYSYNPTPPELGQDAFAGYGAVHFYDPNTPIHVPVGSKEAYQNAPNWDAFHNYIDDVVLNEWYYEILNDDGSITYQYLYQANDTVIQDDPIHIIVKINTLYDKRVYNEVTHEYIYENDGKVYWWNKTLQMFTVLYDYTAEAGDEWEIKVGTESIVMHVDAVENIEHDGKPYRMMHVSDPDDLFTGDIICGIGHLTSFFPEKLMSKGYRVEGIRCFWQEGNLTFKFGDSDCDGIYEGYHTHLEETDGTVMVYPNPTNGIITVLGIQAGEYLITNLLGQTLMTGRIDTEKQQINVSALPTGVYFINLNGKTTKFMKY